MLAWRMVAPPPFGSRQFFAHHAPQRLFQRLLSSLYVLSQDAVDEGLVVPTASIVDLLAEPIQHVVVETDGDTRLPGRRRHHGTALPREKSYSRFIAFMVSSSGTPAARVEWPCGPRRS